MPVLAGAGSTSGSTNYALTRNEIITAALRKLRVVDPNDAANANDVTTGAQALNLMIKAWQIDGIGVWLNQEVVLHLEKNAQDYDLGPSGDYCCLKSDATRTQLATAASANDGTLTVDSDDSIADGDYIGIELDSGALEWTTVNGTPAANVVTLSASLSGAAAVDNYIFSLTNLISRPAEIVEARIRDTDNNDEPLEIITSLSEFMAITDKTASGDAEKLHMVPTITNSKLYVWPVADNVQKRIVMTIKRKIEDFDAADDYSDMDVSVFECLIWNLAKRLMPEYGISRLTAQGAEIVTQADEMYMKVKDFYKERTRVQFTP